MLLSLLILYHDRSDNTVSAMICFRVFVMLSNTLYSVFCRVCVYIHVYIYRCICICVYKNIGSLKRNVIRLFQAVWSVLYLSFEEATNLVIAGGGLDH